MTLLDWSDAESMFGMLGELVADTRADCEYDPERLQFVEDLLAELRIVEATLTLIPAADAIERLKELHESVEPGFADDPVVIHLRHCIDELERIGD
jgi:hypothetical protein